MPSLPMPNVVSFIQQNAARFPKKPALIADHPRPDSLTFAELWAEAQRLAAGLQKQGLKNGERVIVMVPMSLALYPLLMAILTLGGVAVFVDPWMPWSQIAAFCDFAEPTAYIGTFKSHLLRWFSPRLRRMPLTLSVGRTWWGFPAAGSLQDFRQTSGEVPLFPVTPETPALITFTSGSSGLPKGANRTHGFLAAQHAALSAEFPYRGEECDLCSFPVFALNNLASGITTVIPHMNFSRVAQVQAPDIVHQINTHGVTQCTVSPPFLDRLAAWLQAHPTPLPRLKKILTGGAPVSQAQLRTWEAQLPGVEILVVYGSTEAEPVAHISASERLRLPAPTYYPAPGFCSGRFNGHVRTKIIDLGLTPSPGEPWVWPTGEKGVGEIGELIVTGKHVCKDYFRNPTAFAENKIVDAAGEIWHRMGDTGYLDAQGYFWLVGRVHSTLRVNGQLLHPQLVEQVILEEWPQLTRAALVGLTGADASIKTWVVLEGTPTPGLTDAIQRRLLEASWRIDEVRFTRRPLPLDPRHNSKIDYARLRKQLEKQVPR